MKKIDKKIETQLVEISLITYCIRGLYDIGTIDTIGMIMRNYIDNKLNVPTIPIVPESPK